MDSIDTLQELEVLKTEMEALKQTLNKEKIVNDKLLRAVMRHNTSWINKFVKFETIILIPTYLLFVMMCHVFHISQWFSIIFLVLAGIDTIADYRTYRISPKLFSICSMVEIRKRLMRQKKERFIQLCISLPACVVWVMAFGWQMIKSFNQGDVNYFFLNEGSIVGGAIGGIIGVIVTLWIHRKAQRTNDTIIGEINDDEIK